MEFRHVLRYQQYLITSDPEPGSATSRCKVLREVASSLGRSVIALCFTRGRIVGILRERED